MEVVVQPRHQPTWTWRLPLTPARGLEEWAGWESSQGDWRHARNPSALLLSLQTLTIKRGERSCSRFFGSHSSQYHQGGWIPRPQSCVAGPPGGAGHYCSPAQSQPQEPRCFPPTHPTRPGALMPPPQLGRYREGRVLVSSPTPFLGLLNSFAFKYC